MYIVAVAGNIGSGKSTVAKLIAKHFNYLYIPQRRKELSYINDFFDDIPKLFLATQLAFLINKIQQINDYSKMNNIVIDRSLYEDKNIFAQFWIDNYNINNRDVELYNDISNFLLQYSLKPNLTILCTCSSDTIKKRIEARGKRDFEKKYPPNYIEKLNDYYKNIYKCPISDYMIELDSESIDLMDENNQTRLINELMPIIRSPLSDKHVHFSDLSKENHEKPFFKIIRNPD